ncbi:hypothetical protein Tco_1246153 [Tanacetum coccineum]
MAKKDGIVYAKFSNSSVKLDFTGYNPSVTSIGLSRVFKDRQDKIMTKLTQKGVKFDWGAIKQEAALFKFDNRSCAVAPILALPEGSEEISFSIMRCFKEGFGRCVDAKRKGRNYNMRQRRWLELLSLDYDFAEKIRYYTTGGTAEVLYAGTGEKDTRERTTKGEDGRGEVEERKRREESRREEERNERRRRKKKKDESEKGKKSKKKLRF